MISRLRGILLAKKPPQILMEVQGVGYELQASLSTIFQLPQVGQEIILYTEFIVREDAHKLFGFLTEFERMLFNKITKVSGIGPKIALTLLSSLSPDQFIKTVQSSDVNRLVSLPGVGRKTAERLVLELKDKFSEELSLSPNLTEATSQPSHINDAKAALMALGYSLKEVQKVMTNFNESELKSLTTEEIIKRSLTRLLKVFA